MYSGAHYIFVGHGSRLIYTHVCTSGIMNRALDTIMEIQENGSFVFVFLSVNLRLLLDIAV